MEGWSISETTGVDYPTQCRYEWSMRFFLELMDIVKRADGKYKYSELAVSSVAAADALLAELSQTPPADGARR